METFDELQGRVKKYFEETPAEEIVAKAQRLTPAEDSHPIFCDCNECIPISASETKSE